MSFSNQLLTSSELKIAVTGAGGFLGSELVRQLLAQQLPVRAIVLPDDDLRALSDLNTEIVRANITEPETLEAAFSGIEMVFHTVALIKLSGFETAMRLVNVEGTRNVINACRSQGVRRLVYTSSIHVLTSAEMVTEESPINPATAPSAYSQSKAEATLLVRAAAETGLETAILYPVGLSGPGDWRLSPLGQVMVRLISKKPTGLTDGGYYFIDVRDAARLHLAAALAAPSNQEYILSAGYITVRDIVADLEHGGFPTKAFFLPSNLAYLAATLAPLISRFSGRPSLLNRFALDELRSSVVISGRKAERTFPGRLIPLERSFLDAAHWYQSHLSRSTKWGA